MAQERHWEELMGAMRREVILDRRACRAIGVTSFILLTSLGAWVRIPLVSTPVPITFQTFFVLLSGAVLGRKLGALSQGGYLLLGMIGLPIFAAEVAGLSYLFGPTGGYLVGFVLASWVVGRLTPIQGRLIFLRITVAMIVGSLIIYLLGASHLILFTPYGLRGAFVAGVKPFILWDALKLLAASALYRNFQTRSSEIFREGK